MSSRIPGPPFAALSLSLLEPMRPSTPRLINYLLSVSALFSCLLDLILGEVSLSPSWINDFKLAFTRMYPVHKTFRRPP